MDSTLQDLAARQNLALLEDPVVGGENGFLGVFGLADSHLLNVIINFYYFSRVKTIIIYKYNSSMPMYNMCLTYDTDCNFILDE